MRYLFLVHIGPVQDFIASARRTRDLAFGSWFLSELSRAAACAIEAQNGLNSLIFPAPDTATMLQSKNQEFLVANKIIAWVQQSPRELGASVQRAIIAELHFIRDRAYKEIRFADDRWRLMAEKQVDRLFEFFWVALPFDGEDYPQTRRQLEALMAARKNTRNFPQVTGESVPKSSITGQLESVIPDKEYPANWETEAVKREKAQKLYKNYRAGIAERLSGVDLLKRRGATAYGEHFQSTSHMATLPFLERLKSLPDTQLREIQKAWQEYIEKMQKLAFSPDLERTPVPHLLMANSGTGSQENYDGSLLLEGRLVDMIYAPGEDAKRRGERLQRARLALETFYKEFDHQCETCKLEKARPDTYYAFLQADGDGMGELIDAQAQRSDGKHREFSLELSRFAGRAREIVERHRGALIYAGGDDVVALLPLDTMLECASELAKTFRATLQNFTSVDSEGQTRAPSLSTGIAIAHHLESLQQVRQLAKQAEERAKGLEGKNALAITLSKRSGEDYGIAGHWDDLDISLQRLIAFASRGAIPTGTAYELRDLLLRLGVLGEETHTSSQKQDNNPYSEVIKRDALRIIKRKLSVPKDKFPPGQIEEIMRFFKARLDMEQPPHPDIEHVHPVALGELINELIIAQVLAEAKEIATPTKMEGSPA